MSISYKDIPSMTQLLSTRLHLLKVSLSLSSLEDLNQWRDIQDSINRNPRRKRKKPASTKQPNHASTEETRALIDRKQSP